jgi:hypothetical protein
MYFAQELLTQRNNQYPMQIFGVATPRNSLIIQSQQQIIEGCITKLSEAMRAKRADIYIITSLGLQAKGDEWLESGHMILYFGSTRASFENKIASIVLPHDYQLTTKAVNDRKKLPNLESVQIREWTHQLIHPGLSSYHKFPPIQQLRITEFGVTLHQLLEQASNKGLFNSTYEDD